MVTRIGGQRRKTRGIMSKPKKQRGKISLRNYLQSFKDGHRVVLKAEPAVQSGNYFRRFHGRVGKIEKKVGSCYAVSITDGGKDKILIVHPVHLRSL